jgi:hypothetical protein
MTPDIGSFEESVPQRTNPLAIQRPDWMNVRPTKKNNRKRSVPTNAKKVAERAMSGVLERKKWHRRHGKRGSG